MHGKFKYNIYKIINPVVNRNIYCKHKDHSTIKHKGHSTTLQDLDKEQIES